MFATSISGSTYCLTNPAGYTLDMAPCTGKSTQLWTGIDTNMLVNQNGAKYCLTTAGWSQNPGGIAETYACQAGLATTTWEAVQAQSWSFENGLITMTGTATPAMCLTATSLSGNVEIQPCTGTALQTWHAICPNF